MSQALWYVKHGDGERGPLSTDQLRRMAKNGEIRPDSQVRKGTRNAHLFARPAFCWEKARRLPFLAGFFEENGGCGANRQDGNAALSEFIPNFDPDGWDEGALKVFRCIVECVNRLREGPRSRNAGTSCPFSLNLDWDYWDADLAELLAQVRHALEQLRAALEDGEPFPSANFLFSIDESIFDNDVVVFVRRIQAALNDLRAGESARAMYSHRTLFDFPHTHTQDRTDSTPPSKSAQVPDCKDESSWQSLVARARDRGQHGKAVELAKQAVSEHPCSDWLWRELGGELTKLDRLDEAENALDSAHRLNPKAEWLWRRFAALHQKRNDLEGEIESLETLCSLGVATWYDLHQLGIAYHNYRNLAKALKYYRLSAAAKPQAVAWVNLALVYSDPQFSQDADAADACRRALALKPDYQRAKELLDTAKRKLVALAARAQSTGTMLVQSDELSEFISPFEMLQMEEMTAAEGLDAKAMQKAKKRLLHELELNDGRVSWLGDYSLDKSHALAVLNELDDEAKRRYHVEIFRNKPLLNFLTRGDIQHFLYSDSYFPCDTEELLHQDPGFRTYLSKWFAKQYNRVLTRAIEQQRLPVVEVLFGGRRWVEPEDDDLCFAGASKRVGDIVEKLRSKVRNAGSRKVSLREMKDFLQEHSLPELFNLLPAHFAPYQKDIAYGIRSLAISCFNTHDDPELSKGILRLCTRFTSRSVALTEKLQEDFQAIEEKIHEDRKHSFSAVVHRGQSVQITRAGIRFGTQAAKSADIEIVRWGVFVRTVNGVKKEHSFSLVVGCVDRTLQVQWDMPGLLADMAVCFRKSEEGLPISLLSTQKQHAYYERMIDAVLHYLVPPLLDKLVQRLQAGRNVAIGPCVLTSAGITFTMGLFFQTNHVLPWQDVEIQTGSGQVTVISRTNRDARVSMPARDTDNAVILPILCAVMKDRASAEETQQGSEVATYRKGQETLNKPAFFGCAVAAMVIGLVVVLNLDFGRTLRDPTPTTDPSSRSDTPPVSPSAPVYGRPSAPSTPSSDSRSLYRIPSYMKAELDRESRAIDAEKATAERLASQVERLGRELERAEPYLDRSSEWDVNDFNKKVAAYNTLLARMNAQNRRVNQLIDRYNEKLQRYAR